MSDGDGKLEILAAIRQVARDLGCSPSRSQFRSNSGISESRILKHFPSWREAVRAAGLAPDTTNIRLDDDELLAAWGEFVREHRHIPTRDQYRRDGKFSVGAFEKHFGPWSAIPDRFREFADRNASWADVAALLPQGPSSKSSTRRASEELEHLGRRPTPSHLGIVHSKLEARATYGNPIDFRGLRHEPVNEQGVVFLFGMVALELGYYVEAVQTGFPDCEAKRQVGPNKWQRVRIEFEFESRNFRDHGHPQDGCDVIVCWRHNWSECPDNLEVLELSTIIETLAKTED